MITYIFFWWKKEKCPYWLQEKNALSGAMKRSSVTMNLFRHSMTYSEI